MWRSSKSDKESRVASSERATSYVKYDENMTQIKMAENLCYTSMKKFQNKWGKIPNVSDKDFFTNSVHVPVWEEMTPFEKIDIESQLAGYSSAGNIMYTELKGSVKHNIQALETLVNYAMDKDLPYFAINVPNDQCMNCGYCDEMNDECPMCGSKILKD